MIKQKLEQTSHATDHSNDFVQLERTLETSSLNLVNEPLQTINSLSDFYKKKSFAKTLTSKTPFNISNMQPHLMNTGSINHDANKSAQLASSVITSTSARFIKPAKSEVRASTSKNWKLILDEVDSSDDSSQNDNNGDASSEKCLSEEEMKSFKKKRLSMSPLNKIEDTLYWIKNHQSTKHDNKEFENKELSLTGDFKRLVLN